MSEASKKACLANMAPPFAAGDPRTIAASKKGNAVSAQNRRKRAKMRDTLDKVLRASVKGESLLKKLRPYGMKPANMQEALVMLCVITAAEHGDTDAMMDYAKMLGELDTNAADSNSKVDELLAAIDRMASEDGS